MEAVNYCYKELNLSNCHSPRCASGVTIMELSIAIAIALYILVWSSSSLLSMNGIYSWFSCGKEILIDFIAQYSMVTTSITRSFHTFMLWQSGWQITTFCHKNLWQKVVICHPLCHDINMWNLLVALVVIKFYAQIDIFKYDMAFLTTFPKRLWIYQMYCFVASVTVWSKTTFWER